MKKVGFSKTVLSGVVLFLPLFLAAKPCSIGDAWAKYVPEFNRMDDELYANAISNSAAEAFLRENAPSFSCPDAELERIYHFRWWTYRKHLRIADLGFGFRKASQAVCAAALSCEGGWRQSAVDRRESPSVHG